MPFLPNTYSCVWYLYLFLELLGDILCEKPEPVDGVDSLIVVHGCPQVGPDRFGKLKNVVSKLYGKFGNIVNEHYPLDENGFTKG